jgi:hypothetical protein
VEKNDEKIRAGRFSLHTYTFASQTILQLHPAPLVFAFPGTFI